MVEPFTGSSAGCAEAVAPLPLAPFALSRNWIREPGTSRISVENRSEVLAVLAPLAGLHLARDVDQAALLRVLGQHVDQPVLEGDDPVPLGLVDPLAAGVPVDVALVGGDAQVGHAAPRCEMIHGHIGAEAADDFGAIQSKGHCAVSCSCWLMTMECERPGRLSPPPSPFTLPALHSNSGLTPDPVSEEMERCGLSSAAPYGANGDGTITRSPGKSTQTQQGAS